jgi:6-pyruvoyltetrahydropterin/6-carboxytetrahydropterin synthase
MRVTICRWAHFNAAHRLHNDNWSLEKNTEVFGKCNNPNYHGHNYEMEVCLTGEIDPETGYLFDLADLKHIITTEIEDRYDHKNLNLDCPEFKNQNPTVELISYEIYQILRAKIDIKYDIQLRLWETPRNSVYYPPLS